MSRAARSGDAPPLVPALDHEAVAAELANILSGEAFSRSDRLQRFLRFIVDETLNARYLNEYRIATEVYDRKPSFDPASDSIVRVEAGRLRQRLALYYPTEREDPPVLIELPQRTYVPVFRFRPTPAVSMPEPIPIPPTKEPASRWRGPGRTITIAAVMIISAVIFLLSSWSPFRSFFGRPVPTVAA